MNELLQEDSQRYKMTALLRFVPAVVVFLHTLLVLVIAMMVARDTVGGESAGFWLLFVVIDFPSSLLIFVLPLLPLEWIGTQLHQLFSGTVSEFSMWYLFLTPLAFALIGGVQYYLLAKWLCNLVIKKR
jgi:hypothetical protein